MNIFERIKLKSMLRNCDYKLAGTVLKQQYYDETKNTELNRLIDEFMADPCFDNAVKLIKYNEMFVFYFTESCHGGLYVRKNNQPEDSPSTNSVSRPSNSSPSEVKAEKMTKSADIPMIQAEPASPQVTIKKTETADELIEKARQTVARKLAELEKKADSPKQRAEEQPKEKLKQEEGLKEAKLANTSMDDQKQIVQDISISPKRVTSSVVFPDPEPEAEPQPNEEFNTTSKLELESNRIAKQESKPEPKQKQASKPEPQVKPPSGLLSKFKDDSMKGDPQPAVLETAVAVETPIDLLKINPQETNFPNVISTLMIDIQEMARQMEEFRAMMFQQPQDAVKLQKWSNTLQEAIEEFEAAVKVLSRQ